MKHYHSYMNRQESSPELHEKLLNLEAEKTSSRRPWARYGALAACAALILGVGVWKLIPAPNPALNTGSAGQFAADSTPLPGQKDTVDPENLFVVSSPAEDGEYGFYCMPAITYPDMTGSPELAASIALPEGAFMAGLEKEDIQKLFWPEGKPENTDCDLPWALFWDGYTVHGYAWYSGQGELFQAHIFGEKDRAVFELTLRPGHLPLSCLAEPDRVTSDAFGVEVTGWSKSYDRNGDEITDYICGSEFMAGDVGVRFESWNNGKAEDGIDGEAWFNTLFIREALVGGLHLEHLLTTENIPAWREEGFNTLAQARREADFAPYLPAEAPVAGYDEFAGRLSYQEGSQNMLFVRWSRGYDDVEIAVYFPEGDSLSHCKPVDINVPASYDVRLYSIPWCDSVPREYAADFYSVTFRAQDMSLEAVRARETEHDTGGSSFHFKVLHDSGVMASYSCDGMTAEQVWALVESTL